ncbi:DUF1977-domain-containing protein [Patellaria atrata CBS 101060]|uniref:DUF1977-domain-containing protein n=1 Tax=Patellaria atrata CBS 101060 TaxID=1346257 RepID=A0A9P4VSN2_9PEZI|nr:DUF1977-domain-containing protein [Patellaria atrata CBS 101060]
MSAKASGADARPNGDTKHRAHHDGSAGRSFTPEQKAAVIRIKRCSPTSFYEILGLEEVKLTCSEGEIKKAYRKLSLLTHPDKNGYEGADEAFKLVSRAFQVLSDPDKKAKFDKFGGDPDNRFGGGASASTSSPFSNFRSPGAGARGPMFEEELTPEEMFRQFFGGGLGGGFGGPFATGFDTGPGFVFNLGGGPGIRVHQFGGGRPRRRPASTTPQQPPSAASTLSSLLPLLLLFLLPLLSSLFSSPDPSTPNIRFDPVPPYTHPRTFGAHKLPYYVNPAETEDMSPRKWRELDKAAERRFVSGLSQECAREEQQQLRMMQDAQGWFFVDEGLMERARGMELRGCKRLRELGYVMR